ncbi:MAG: amino acid permease [Oligoflexia bacterium]|nr:amino acid permease [Oligoflexia bacterium]
MMKQLWATKSIDKIMQDTGELNAMKRTLGALNLTTLGIGAIIGAGIFILTGNAAAQYAGPAIVLSFILSGFACAMTGLCYAEFASMIPLSGSAYTYAYATLGELIAWTIGWDLILEYLFASSTVAVGWSGYVVSFLKDFGVIIPAYLSNATGTSLLQLPDTGQWVVSSAALLSKLSSQGLNPDMLPHMTAIINLPAMLIIGLLTILLVIGISESANFNNIVVFVKLAVVITLICVGFAYINKENWSPFIPENTGEFGHFGWSGILRGAGVIFFAYIGFDAVSTAAQEAKNPQRDMPIGILASLAVCTILYILVSLTITGMVDYKLLAVPDPIAVAVDAAGPELFWLRPLVKIGAIAGLSSVILVMLLGQPRIFYSMAKDGLLPKSFTKIHPRYKTPFVPTIVTGVIAALIAGSFPINILGELVSIGTLLAFTIVCLGVLFLRYKRPDIKRSFKTPWVPVVPILGAAFSILQMAALPGDTWIRLIIWMAIGFFIYFLYGKRNSLLKKENK